MLRKALSIPKTSYLPAFTARTIAFLLSNTHPWKEKKSGV
jgi:hypothetical protein